MADDPRYILLCEDGSYVTLGRAKPDADAVEAARKLFDVRGLNGWICSASNSRYSRFRPRMEIVETIGSPTVAFDVSVTLGGGKVKKK